MALCRSSPRRAGLSRSTASGVQVDFEFQGGGVATMAPPIANTT
jgi:hypothetical protein